MSDVEKEKRLEAAQDFLAISARGRTELNRLFNPDYERVGKLGERAVLAREPVVYQGEGDLPFDEIKSLYLDFYEKLSNNPFSGPLMGHDMRTLHAFITYLFDAMGETEPGQVINKSLYAESDDFTEHSLTGFTLFRAILKRLERQADFETNGSVVQETQVSLDGGALQSLLNAPARICSFDPSTSTYNEDKCVFTVNGKRERKSDSLQRIKSQLRMDPSVIAAFGYNFFQNAFHPDKGAATQAVQDISYEAVSDTTTISFKDNGNGMPLDSLELDEHSRQPVFLPNKSFSGSTGLGLADMDILIKALVPEGCTAEVKASNDGLEAHLLRGKGASIDIIIRPEASAADVQNRVDDTLKKK